MSDKKEIPPTLLGVILAGGQSTRMNGTEKSFLKFGATSLIKRTIDRFNSQVPKIILSANSNPDKFRKYNVPIIKDDIKGYAGPLAGVLSAMHWAQSNKPTINHIITVAVDTPFFPNNYAKIMQAKHQNKTQITIANSNNRNHPVFAIWDINLADDLERFLVNEGNRKVMMFAERYNFTIQQFDYKSSIDPFFNINTYENLTEAQKHL